MCAVVALQGLRTAYWRRGVILLFTRIRPGNNVLNKMTAGLLSRSWTLVVGGALCVR